MPDMKTEMPRRNPDDEMSGIQAGGLPGNQAGGDWEGDQPNVEVIERHLVGIEYPIRRDDLVQHIRWQKAPLQIVYFVEQLPNQEYRSAEEIGQALRQIA